MKIPARNGRAIEVWLIAAFTACPGAALPELAEVGHTTTGMIRHIARLLVQRGALRKLGDSYEPAKASVKPAPRKPSIS